MSRTSPETETPTGLIDKRLADLREANDIFRASSWDRCSAIERNQREISWLTKLRTVFTSALAQTPAVGVCEALALRLRDAMQTAQNDDLSEPLSEKRDRHAIRVDAMLDAAEYLEEMALALSQSSTYRK